MKLLWVTLFLFIGLGSFSGRAEAGVVNGGGGKSVVCRDDKSNIVSARLLDLFEAEYQFGLSLLADEKSFEKNLEKVGDRMTSLEFGRSNYVPHSSYGALFATHQQMRFLPKGIALQQTADSYDVLMPVGCEVEQLAIYQERNLILVVSDIWEKLPALDQAALVAHEMIYREHREAGIQDSRAARRLVGHLFSSTPLEFHKFGVPSEVLKCAVLNEGLQYEFFVYTVKHSNGARETRLQFTVLNRKKVWALTYSSVYDGPVFKTYEYLTGARKPILPGVFATTHQAHVFSPIWSQESYRMELEGTKDGQSTTMLINSIPAICKMLKNQPLLTPPPRPETVCEPGGPCQSQPYQEFPYPVDLKED